MTSFDTKNNEMNASVRPIDIWNVRRMIIAGLLGTTCAVHIRIFDFWPVGSADGLRGLLDLLGVPLLFLLVVGILFFWFISAFIALCRRRFRGMASSLIAIVIVPACLVTIVNVPLFDPWLWYIVFNKSSFEAAAAANDSPQNSPKFTIIEEREITTGIAGVTQNHFVVLIYSESDPDKLALSNSALTRIYGNFYRRDEYQ